MFKKMRPCSSVVSRTVSLTIIRHLLREPVRPVDTTPSFTGTIRHRTLPVTVTPAHRFRNEKSTRDGFDGTIPVAKMTSIGNKLW
jgi:hypothetical protein